MLAKFQKLPWYWHRLRAMRANEIALRLQKKAHQLADAKYKPPRGLTLDPKNCFPALPKRGDAPGELLVGEGRNRCPRAGKAFNIYLPSSISLSFSGKLR